jgi:hypothetical protein
MPEQYDINRLWIERPDLYDRTKLAKGHPDRLTLPAAKRIAAKEVIPGSRLPYGIAPETARPSDALAAEIYKRIADRYIARI